MRVRLDIAYDGADFRGFWPNEGFDTVGGEIQRALERMYGELVPIVCAGRTDKGVHARHQVVTFDVPNQRANDDFDAGKMRFRLNKLLQESVRVNEVAVVGSLFDARFTATARHYRYHIWNHPVADPLWRRTTWHVRPPLELASMRIAADAVVGLHDFGAFCRRPDPVPDAEPATLVRRVYRSEWHVHDDGRMYYEVEASAFCHQMVRSLVGTMVDVGRGFRPASQMRAILASQDRSLGGQVAPPHGLVLWQVDY